MSPPPLPSELQIKQRVSTCSNITKTCLFKMHFMIILHSPLGFQVAGFNKVSHIKILHTLLVPIHCSPNLSTLTLILRRSRTGTVWFYTSTSNKRAVRPKLYTKSLTGDLELMYSRLTLVRISINL